MAVNLSIKNVPDAVATRLRERAGRNHRSLQGELMAILEQVLSGPAPVSSAVMPLAAEPARSLPRLSIDEVARRAARLFPGGTTSSVEFLRAMRNGRYGEEWAHTGRHSDSG